MAAFVCLSGNAIVPTRCIVPEGHKPGLDFNSSNWARYCISVPVDGLYRVEGRVRALDGGSDSFFVQIDNGPVWEWHVQQSGVFITDLVSDHRTNVDPVEVYLQDGDHDVIFYAREDKAGLDTVTLINVSNPVAALRLRSRVWIAGIQSPTGPFRVLEKEC